MPIGSERVFDGGYLFRKVAETKPARHGWKAVHHIIWEEAHGPVPAGHAVTFRDGNRQNCAIENLMLVSRAQLATMNRLGIRSSGGEAALALADLHSALYRRQQGANRKNRGRPPRSHPENTAQTSEEK
jgi:hypothetical protein